MKQTKFQRAFGRMLAAALISYVASVPALERDPEASAQRWQQLRDVIFPDRDMLDGAGLIVLDLPMRAAEAALVPIAIRLPNLVAVKGLYLIIDDNPAPLAAHFVFGPQADTREIRMRVRVNQYTDIHAVVETSDGRLYVTSQYIKAAGGCSAPVGKDETQALVDIGAMHVQQLQKFVPDQALPVELSVHHPNFNGMQMDQITRNFTPARYIRSIDSRYGDQLIFHMDTDISLSTDPTITFSFVPHAPGDLDFHITDTSGAEFHQHFPIPVN